MEEILSLGLRCHNKLSFDQSERKMEIELMYDDRREKQRSKLITVSEVNIFKCELERSGAQRIRDHRLDVLNKDQYKKVRELRNNPHIAIRKAYRSNAFVILNSQCYNNGMEELVSDESEFVKIHQYTTVMLKNQAV